MRTLLKPLSFIPAILLMVMIFNFSSQSGDVSSNLSYGVSYKIVEAGDYILDAGLEPWQMEEWANKINFITRKLAHMTEYFALAVAVSFPLYVYGMHGILLMLVAGIICVGFATGDEYHQSFVAGRSPSWKDVGIDSVGVFFGIILVRLVGWTGRMTIFKPKNRKPKVKKVKKVKRVKGKNRKFKSYTTESPQYHYTEEHTYYKDTPKRSFQSPSSKKSQKLYQDAPPSRNPGPPSNYSGQWQPGNDPFYYGADPNNGQQAPYGQGQNIAGQAPYRQGQNTAGQAPYGQGPNTAGQAPYRQGQNTAGQAPYGQGPNTAGQAPYRQGQNTAGQVPYWYAQNPDGLDTYGDRQPYGEADPYRQGAFSSRQAPYGSNPYQNGSMPYGSTPNNQYHPNQEQSFQKSQQSKGNPYWNGQPPSHQAPAYHTTDDFENQTKYYDRHQQYEEESDDSASKDASEDDMVDGPIEIIQKLGSKIFRK